MSTPPATTTTVVAVTMTPAAVRTDGGSLRSRDMRRSMTFKRPTCGTLRPSDRLWAGLHEGSDQPEEREEDPKEEHPPVAVSERPEAQEEEQQQVQKQAADTDSPPHTSSIRWF